MAHQNVSVVLAERPLEDIIPGKTFTRKVEPAPTAADLKDGEILVESLYLSLDPAMRGWLRDQRSYLPPVQIGEVMRGVTVARVLASKSSRAKEGDIVVSYSGWREVAILNEKQFDPPFPLPSNSKITDLIGVFGTTGLTAYFGLEKIGNVKPGDTVVVSGAAGATGSIVGQIAKLKGARVVGIAGSEAKLKWLTEELGFDAALNYKDANFKAKFKEATPKFIDVYWDNVGGEILDMALGRANKSARFVMCGGISQYNAATVQGPKNINNVIAMRIRLEGFIVMDYRSEYDQGREQLAKWVAEGKLKSKETIVKGGLEAAEQALVDLFRGANTGKLLVEIKNPEGSPKL